MDPVLLQSPVTAQSAGLGIFLEMNFEPVLRESVERFLTGINSEGFDFAGFRSVLSRQLQSSADPPIEIVWLYAAAGYYESISARSSVGRVRVARDLLQLLSSCSAAVGGTKCIALTAPAVYDLYQCAVEDGLVDEKTLAEIERFSEAILSYLSICSGHCKDLEGINTGLHSSFLDLVRVWTLRRSADEGSLEMFFPLVGDEVRKRFVEKERCGIGYLAGVVIAEAFLLRLCLKVKAGGASRKGLQKELVVWAVSSITAFSNRIFFGNVCYPDPFLYCLCQLIDM
ncbi:hypothetical protein AXF42_Ash011219 [Apostasia shenzhenica]|uniref:Uncharacterized protein n=1 Tax=Apostasia shenzhenica TaxID=1088818 RepID=A0A2I0AL51_9ASPA|nr:hypothetical protein AXF42_Ash011219 [Apostasia shenzhenica]